MDSEDGPASCMAIVTFFELKMPLLQFDVWTKKRLAMLPNVKHINSLIVASHQHLRTETNLGLFFLSLGMVWPGSREKMLSTVVVHMDRGLVREL